MNKLKSAIIGLGHQAIEDHIPGLKDSQFASLEAICDIDEEIVDGYIKAFKKVIRNYHEVL